MRSASFVECPQDLVVVTFICLRHYEAHIRGNIARYVNDAVPNHLDRYVWSTRKQQLQELFLCSSGLRYMTACTRSTIKCSQWQPHKVSHLKFLSWCFCSKVTRDLRRWFAIVCPLSIIELYIAQWQIYNMKRRSHRFPGIETSWSSLNDCTDAARKYAMTDCVSHTAHAQSCHTYYYKFFPRGLPYILQVVRSDMLALVDTIPLQSTLRISSNTLACKFSCVEQMTISFVGDFPLKL